VNQLRETEKDSHQLAHHEFWRQIQKESAHQTDTVCQEGQIAFI